MEPKNNYALSTEQNDAIPLDVAKPSRVYLNTANTTGVTLTLTEDDNNIFSVNSEALTFISVNSAITDYADLNLAGFNEGVYVVTEGYTHILALPKTIYVFSALTDPAKRVVLQEIVRWAAIGGQAISYGVS